MKLWEIIADNLSRAGWSCGSDTASTVACSSHWDRKKFFSI